MLKKTWAKQSDVGFARLKENVIIQLICSYKEGTAYL